MMVESTDTMNIESFDDDIYYGLKTLDTIVVYWRKASTQRTKLAAGKNTSWIMTYDSIQRPLGYEYEFWNRGFAWIDDINQNSIRFTTNFLGLH